MSLIYQTQNRLKKIFSKSDICDVAVIKSIFLDLPLAHSVCQPYGLILFFVK